MTREAGLSLDASVSGVGDKTHTRAPIITQTTDTLAYVLLSPASQAAADGRARVRCENIITASHSLLNVTSHNTID